MNENAQFATFILAWMVALFASVVVWAVWIRQYVRQNGRSLGHGANIGWTIIADASIATEIGKEKGKLPWFLKVFWIVEATVWLIPILGITLAAIRYS